MTKIRTFFKIILFVSPIFLIGCKYNEVVITFRSEPTGARIYNSHNGFIGKTPVKLTYDVQSELYDNGNTTWDLGYVKAYLEGYEPKIQKVVLDISNHRNLSFWSLEGGRSATYNYYYLIEFNSPKSQQANSDDEFYISSFQDTKAGSLPNKRDSFVKDELPVVVILGNKGKLVNIKVYSISLSTKVFDNSTYVPEQNINTYKTIPLNNLLPDSYKVQCIVEGVEIKTLFFSISN